MMGVLVDASAIGDLLIMSRPMRLDREIVLCSSFELSHLPLPAVVVVSWNNPAAIITSIMGRFSGSQQMS
jgi:hypothetical protein